MKTEKGPLRIAIALAMGGAVAVTAMASPFWFALAKDSWFPPSFVTHTKMLLTSLMLIAILSKGRLSEYGLTKGSFRFTPTILLWIIPTSVLSVLQFAAMGAGGPAPDVFNMSPAQDILFIWIYASICEEVLVRGLLQGFLSPLGQNRITLFSRWPLTIPVIFSALFFGAMHIVLWSKMGLLVIVPMTLATGLGFVAGLYREKTGSVLPAILIHGLFNIGGSLPGWILTAIAA